MKTLINAFVVLIIICVGITGYAQETVNRKIDSFNSIGVTGNIRVELYKSDNPAIEITLKDLPEEHVITELKNEKLGIRLKTGSNKNAVIKVKVFYTNLENLSVSTNGLIVSPEIITGKNINFVARSGGKMELELKLEELKADVDLGAILVFKGEVKNQVVSVTTGGTYSAFPLKATDSHVKASAGGKAKVTAGRIIEANSNSGGYIAYIGDPVSETIKTSLGGEIKKFKSEEAVDIE